MNSCSFAAVCTANPRYIDRGDNVCLMDGQCLRIIFKPTGVYSSDISKSSVSKFLS